MQAQAHISGQVPGRAGGQLPGLAQQIWLPSQGSGERRSWHMDTDAYAVRQYIIEKISQNFQRRQIPRDWQLRLLDFVRSVEEGLFKEANSKEEYMDLNTLEQRLQALAKRIAPSSRNQNLVHHAPSVGTMIPTLGMQQNGNVSSMIPTPGSDISMVPGPGASIVVPNPVGMGNILPTSNVTTGLSHSNSFMGTDGNSNKMVPTPGLSNNTNIFSGAGDNMSSLQGTLTSIFQSHQGIGSLSMGASNHMMARAGSQMIPTPGSSGRQSLAMNLVSSGGVGYSNTDSMVATQQQQQQQFNGSQNSHIHHNVT